MASRRAASTVVSLTVLDLYPSFLRTLAAENKSPRTIETYSAAVRIFDAFLKRQGMPQAISSINREHVETFIAYLLAIWKPATAANRYRALQAFWKWAVDEGEVTESPMVRMRPPHVPEEPPPVLTEEQLRRLLKTCDGRSFEERRDNAIFRLFMDCGVRLSELAGLTLSDLDLDANVAIVLGKGRRPRACPFGRRTTLALDRYLRARAGHRDAVRPELWLGHLGPMTANGITQLVYRRAKQAGLPGVQM